MDRAISKRKKSVPNEHTLGNQQNQCEWKYDETKQKQHNGKTISYGMSAVEQDLSSIVAWFQKTMQVFKHDG